MTDLRSDLEAVLAQVTVDLDAAHGAIIAKSRHAVRRRRVLVAGAAAIVVAVLVGVAAVATRSDENGTVIVGPVDTTAQAASVAADGISAEVAAAWDVVEATSGTHRLALEISVKNDSSQRILGDPIAVFRGEATLTQNGVELARQTTADYSSNLSSTGPIDTGRSQCWTLSYANLIVTDRSNILTATIPTASLIDPNGGGADLGVIKVTFDPSIIKPVTAAEFDTSTKSPDCG